MIEAYRLKASLYLQENRLKEKYALPEDGKAVFTIRSHHLSKYLHLYLGRTATPEEIAIHTLAPYRMRLRLDPNDSSTADTVGTNTEDFETHKQGQIALYTEFSRLPRAFPVEVTENIPDGLCALCPVGAHCKTKYTDEGIERAEDKDWIDLIIERANAINPLLIQKGAIRFSTRTVDYSDADPEAVRVLHTTAGVLRYILKHW